jgi:hypothetical protein
MNRARLRAIVLLVALLWPAPGPAFAQQPADPTPAAEEPGCAPGELCGSGDRDDRFETGNSQAPDPPGNYVRSLISLGLIAAVIGTYLFIALSGRRLPIRRRKGPA